MSPLARRIFLLILVLSVSSLVQGDTRSKCQAAANAADTTCENTAATQRDARLATVESAYQMCINPFQNPSWTACRNQAYNLCGQNQACLTQALNACQTAALAACNQEKTEATEQWLQAYNDALAVCTDTLNTQLLTCPGPGLCNSDADCQDTNPRDTCSDGKCVSGGCDCTQGQKCCPDGSCYPTASTCPPSPIVLDPFDEGFHLTGPSNGVRFRILPGGPCPRSVGRMRIGEMGGWRWTGTEMALSTISLSCLVI